MRTHLLYLSIAGGAAVLGTVSLARAATGPAGSELRTVTATVPAQDADGKTLYLQNCRTCHGATGMPSGENKEKYPKIKALNDAAFLARLSDDSILTVLKKGKGKDMKSWTEKLNPAEMVAVVKYVRTLPKKG